MLSGVTETLNAVGAAGALHIEITRNKTGNRRTENLRAMSGVGGIGRKRCSVWPLERGLTRQLSFLNHRERNLREQWDPEYGVGKVEVLDDDERDGSAENEKDEPSSNVVLYHRTVLRAGASAVNHLEWRQGAMAYRVKDEPQKMHAYSDHGETGDATVPGFCEVRDKPGIDQCYERGVDRDGEQ